MNIEEFKKKAVAAGMSKFQLSTEKMPREDMFVIGADFLDRLHAQLYPNKEKDNEVPMGT